jgi:hypothetical protein
MTAFDGRQAHASGYRCAWATAVLIGLGVAGGTSRGYPFAGGTGEPNDPYQIATARQLIAVGEDPPLRVKHFIPIADIDLSGTVLSAPVIPTFSGTFDGNGLTIRRLMVDGDWDLGLFGQLDETAVVRNLTLQDVNVAGFAQIGSLAGQNGGNVTACSATDAVMHGVVYVGGLVGANNGLLRRCYSCGSLQGQFPVGRITTDWGGDVIDCFWDVQATGANWSAGGTGLSTPAMKDFFTFLLAGWDFVGESGNGTEDTWIGMINDYPQLRWQHDR